MFPILITIFLVLTVIQVIFLGIVSFCFSRYQPPAPLRDLPISVVICARNEKAHLRNLIPAVCSQNHHTYEVILVDDRSDDGSEEIISGFLEKYKNLNYLRIDEKPDDVNGKKNAITNGIRMAENPHILLTDADCLPASPDWVSFMASGFNNTNKEFVLGFSMYTTESGLLNRLIRFETLWTGIHYLGLALAGFPYMGVGRNLAYSRATFVSKKGFSGFEHVTGGDDDLFVNRNADAGNTSVVMGGPALTWSEPEHTWRDYFRQKQRHLSVGRYYSPASRILLGILSISHIFGYIFMGILLFQPLGWIYSLSGLVIRTLLLLYTFKKASQKLEIPCSTGKILPMDLAYAVIYPVLGISALIRKTIRWK